MSDLHAPRHRRVSEKPARSRRRKAVVLSGVALAATGFAVSGGLLARSTPLDDSAAAALSTSQERHSADSLSSTEIHDLAAREQRVSRSGSDRASAVDRTKAATLSNASGRAVGGSENLASADPKTLTKALMPQFGMDPSQFGCVDNIWSQESGWNIHAENPSSSAYGIPQALPGSKMASAGPNWQNSAETQIRWGLGYIKGRYGSACSAWSFKQGAGWY